MLNTGIVFDPILKKLRTDTLSSSTIASLTGSQENYILAPEADEIGSWNRYADAAGSSPVDGTAGSPNAAFTFALNTTAPLDTIGDFLLTKDANNRQGHGVSYDFSIENKWLGQRMQIKFLYKASANFAAGDLTVFIYDVTNAGLVTVSNGAMAVSTVPKLHECFFTASATSTSYRIIIHVASTNALAYTANFASFFVGGDIAPGEWFAGAGTPESAIAASPGSLYQDSTNGLIYQKRSGTSTTGWIEISRANMKAVTQATHGFVANDVLYNNAGTWTKAISTSAAAAEVVGIVIASLDTNTFLMVTGGYVTGLSGLTANAVHFLSDTTAGLLTTTEPTTIGYISKPLLIADSTTSGFFINMRGQLLTTGATSSSYVTRKNGTTLGATNTGVLIYGTAVNSNGSDISYTTSATLGDVFTVNTSGIYSISISANAATASLFVYQIRVGALDNVSAITTDTKTRAVDAQANNTSLSLCWTGFIASGDNIFITAANLSSNPSGSDANQISVTRVA